MSDELAVQQVLAHYVRAHDRRDGAAMGALFTPEARVTIFYSHTPDGKPEMIGEIAGREAIAGAVTHMMKPHPPRGWSHNATDGLLVDIDGDRATVDAQFMVFSILGDTKPASGWPAGAAGAMGTITPIESGYYHQKLVRVDGQWLIEWLQVRHNLPFAF
ncbi:MAG TPA: nuclear transport factor 2 family protein [Pinirhizobacter sp.]|uniref:nuclear transport factor 2 family protein n=1 Tax=Pinirhizobacter sp. TaxID=2950432 RepID=UPI002BDEC9A8|nr:nuclear transport factor 2 family protein [Pinirhizobacter sp.]HMH69575.1 nuclear transport factor 2 family protein [Pinirhizobacter sp.]